MKRVTIEDVAQAAGVSRQTVSRAINDKEEISQATKDRVLQAVQEMGYRPSRLAQGMVTQRTRTVGLVLADITNPFFPEVTRGVQDKAQHNDYNVFLCNTDAKAEAEMQVLRSLAAQHVDGIILFSHQASDEDLRSFADTYRPLVLINRVFEHPHVNILMVDNYRGGQLAAEYFIENGHTRIGVLTNAVTSLSQVRRLQGFKQEMKDHGLLLANDRIVAAPANLEGGYQAAQQLLSRHPDTTAIFTYNDLMALGAIRASSERGLRIPTDIAIIGFDDIRFAAMATPSLSSVYVDKYAIGQKAMSRLLAMINSPDNIFPPIEMSVKLIIRESA
ncbi:MAG TPA: LacI family DNA-binding transcriptional regulator [Anaerolineae bacterium]